MCHVFSCHAATKSIVSFVDASPAAVRRPRCGPSRAGSSQVRLARSGRATCSGSNRWASSAACRFDVELRQRRVVGTGARDPRVVDRRGPPVEDPARAVRSRWRQRQRGWPRVRGRRGAGDPGRARRRITSAPSARARRAVSSPRPEPPPITTTVSPARSGLALMPSPPGTSPGAHLTSTTSGFPFSTTYVASSAALPLPTFLAEWIVPAGMNKTSPALSVTGGLPSTSYSSEPSRT